MASSAPSCPSALVVVLGDVGRSPRMINHVRALRRRGWRVALAGYGPNPPPPDVAGDAGVSLHLLDGGRAGLGGALWRLARLAPSRAWTAVVVQNPPGFPALLALALAGTGGACRVLDWHNLGGTILALRPGRGRAAGLYGWCERSAARLAHAHWSVSAALARAVERPDSAVVVHDRPSRIFCSAAPPAEDRAVWWRRVLPDVPLPRSPLWIAAPSSWGPDEDTGAMLRAARAWRARDRDGGGGSPRLALIATGRGPGQAEFARAAAEFGAGPVELRTAWIPSAEYAAFLAYADAGLCLHRSSSGLDLPMKLADFRGAGRKALVLDYGPVLEEIFRPGVDGLTFRDDEGLAAELRRVAGLKREDLEAEAAPGDFWEEEWERRLGAWAAALEETRRPV